MSQTDQQAARCEGKHAFDTWAEANEVLKRRRRYRRRKTHKRAVNIFRCEQCGKYHFGGKWFKQEF